MLKALNQKPGVATMNETHHGYVSYLLRLWQAQENGEWIWRASLESPQTSQQYLFATLDELWAFLYEQTKLSGFSQGISKECGL